MAQLIACSLLLKQFNGELPHDDALHYQHQNIKEEAL
jgi:hypothetical protein